MFTSCDQAIREIKKNQVSMQRIFGAADQNKYLSEVGELSNDKNRRKIKLRRLRSPLQTDKLVKRMYYDKVEQKNNCSIRDT